MKICEWPIIGWILKLLGLCSSVPTYERPFFGGAFLLGYPGKISLHFMSTNVDDTWRQNYLDTSKNYGCNLLKFNTLNADKNCWVTPYKGNGFGGDFNEDWLNMCEKWTDKIIEAGMEPFPCLTMDGSDSWTNPKNFNEHKRMMQKFAEKFKGKWNWISISHEGSEYWDSGYSQKFAGMVKECFPEAKVGTQSQEYAIFKACSNLEFLAYEFSWHPAQGNSKTPEAIWDEAKRVSDACGGKGKILFDEFNVDCNGTKAKLQGLACAAQDTNRTMGSNNGFPTDGKVIEFFGMLKPGMSASRKGSIVTMTGNGDTVTVNLSTGEYSKS